jgi:hypothetical protein
MAGIPLRITITDTASKIAAYGAGALGRIEWSATETGTYAEFATFLLVSGTSIYMVWDPTGIDGYWYRVRVSDAGGTNFSVYSAAFPAVAPSAPTVDPSVTAVRLKTSDRVHFAREELVGDGESLVFQLAHSCILDTPPFTVTVNGAALTTAGYSLDQTYGVVTLTALPAVNDKIIFNYGWAIFSDEEIQYFIGDADGNLTIAAARCLLAWAADAAKLSIRETLSGGTGSARTSAQTTRDTTTAAVQLRAMASALIKFESDLGESIPAEGISEIIRTDFDYERAVMQNIIRNS